MSESQANNENQSNVGVGTRSGLVWEIIRILQECGDNKPQVLICENVPQLHSKDNASDFHKLQVELNNMGYINFWEDMNAVDYTQIPQNRNRTFMVSIYDPTKQATYSFPLKTKLKTRLKDFLEKNVDEKYYLSEKDIERISNWNAYEKPLDNVIDTSERESNKCIDNSLWKRQCGNETCESSEMKYICDYRYDEGIRGRENYELCSSLTCKGTGFSGIPLITNKKMRKRLKQ